MIKSTLEYKLAKIHINKYQKDLELMQKLIEYKENENELNVIYKNICTNMIYDLTDQLEQYESKLIDTNDYIEDIIVCNKDKRTNIHITDVDVMLYVKDFDVNKDFIILHKNVCKRIANSINNELTHYKDFALSYNVPLNNLVPLVYVISKNVLLYDRKPIIKFANPISLTFNNFRLKD